VIRLHVRYPAGHPRSATPAGRRLAPYGNGRPLPAVLAEGLAVALRGQGVEVSLEEVPEDRASSPHVSFNKTSEVAHG
jgi:hypothetical protein